jgi:uncharacterized membrane protein
MAFATPLPWWILLVILAAAAGVAWLAYSQWTLTPFRRNILVGLRFITLVALVVFLLRPVSRGPADASHVIVPILVDTSRSMSIEDAEGGVRRIDRARQILGERLLPALEPRFSVEVFGFGEGLSKAAPEQLSAAARRSDLQAALSAVRDRYRGQPIAGIVLLSDGGDTGGGSESAAAGLPPIFPLGVGSEVPGKDREILSVTAAEQVMDDSRVDLAVSAVSHGLGTSPLELRLLENGRPIDIRRTLPAADGTPIREVFQVSPPRGTATVYTIETPALPDELVPENNARSVLVQPPTRRRRVLLVEGAPGFEHSFLKRAWTSDPGLEIDSVVKKGRNEQGADTFYIQSTRARADSLTTGYPTTREALFRYDALVLANLEGPQLTRAQLEATRAFVGQRGGGLLVLGARSFLRQGLGNTAVEEVLPLELTERGSDVVPASTAGDLNRVSLTTAGEAHPVMQLAPAPDETRKRWEGLPALASTAALGGPRPAASVLAITNGQGGARRALVAVQRYGEGRAMIFAGEAAWRWRMMMPATDRVYDTFWKQSLRWLALAAADPINVTVPPGAVPGDPLPITVIVRDGAFEPQPDATVEVRVTGPDGRSETLRASPDPVPERQGRYVATMRPAQSGVFKVEVEARRGTVSLGAAATSLLAGGSDPEMTDPRLNKQLLQRLAADSGGQLLEEDQLAGLPDLLKASAADTAMMVSRDLWHTKWSFAAILTLLGAEWIMRRRWGLR